MQTFKKAKKLYSNVGSTYGVALCKYSVGYIYRSKVSEFINPEKKEDQVFQRSK